MGEEHEVQGCRARYLDSMYRYRRVHCCGCFGIILFLSFIVGTVYPFLQGEAQFTDPNAYPVIASDMITYSQQLFDSAVSEEEEVEPNSILFGYQWKDGRNQDIFNSKNLATMCTIEQLVFRQSDFGFGDCDPENTTEVCVKAEASMVERIYSVANSSFNYEDCTPLDEEIVTNYTRDVFYDSLQGTGPFQGIQSPFRFFTDSITQATITRASILLAHPDEEVAKEKLIKMESELFEFFDIEGSFGRSVYRDPAISGDLQVIFFNGILFENEFDRLLPGDFTMIFGSMFSVGVWMGVYTRSFFLTLTNMSYILLSVPTALFFYKMVFQILFFDFIHILVVFIILGIGADGVFVMIDAWKQSRLLFTDEFERLTYAYNRAVATVFNTSFTTVIAFSSTALTPLIPISTFGVFAALCIAVNFVFICTIVPSTILVWESYVKYNVCSKGKVDETVPELKREESNTSFRSKKETKTVLDDLVGGNNVPFEKYYVPCMLKAKKFVVGLGLLVAILGGVGVTNVSPLTQIEQWLPEDHQLTIFIEDFLLEFLSGEEDEFIALTVFWGVDSIERDTFSRYQGDLDKIDDKLVLDDKFDVSSFDAQLAIIDFCETLENKTCDTTTCQGFDKFALPPTATYEPICTMREFHEWYATQAFAEPLDGLTKAQFNARIKSFTEDPALSGLNLGSRVGIIDGEVKYFSIEYRLTISQLKPGGEMKKYIEILDDDLIPDYKESAPATVKSINYASGEFVQVSVQDSLVETVTRGLLITFPIVFLVLLFATGNLILAALSCLAILSIVVTVLGFVFTVLEWELGTAESIVAIMIVGLSVDYAIHLGHMYTYAGEKEGIESRIDRFHYAVLTIGPTVLAGATTTLIAGVFLFGAQITFFTKMGVLLTLTVCCSLFFSLFFLMACVAWFGPEGTTGNVSAIVKKCRNKDTSTEIDQKVSSSL